MAVSKPFKRTARPQNNGDGKYLGHAHYIKDSRYAAAPAHYIRAFQILQKDLLELFDYVEPADENRRCYSYRINELHTRACIEFEANCKAILLENDYSTIKSLTMSDYKKLEQTHRLSSFQVKLPLWRGHHNICAPLETWKTGNSPQWYKSYNAVKHSRHVNFSQSNFQNMLDAMCGLVAILGSQFVTIDFGPEGFVANSSPMEGYEMAIGGYFEIKFPDDWPTDEWYDFDWHELIKSDPNPFQNLTF